ncbi:MaoC/PaaZ C-terminal domain-containing protein [Arthrobacter sp. 3Tela_A]|uniref:MaoC/PaaZ C-terminal domain-containing protein n=1 Tax=Arthrobacter sp. 3Tela_A TaxID=3093743 RepID=UPI003BB78E00
MTTIDTNTIDVGTVIGPFVRETGLANWNRYAAVNYEFVPIHMDDEAGRAAGMDGAFGMGNLQISYLHALLREWMGENGRLHKFEVQFRKPNSRGTVRALGVITAVIPGDDGLTVELDVWTEDAAGDKMARGTATVTPGR